MKRFVYPFLMILFATPVVGQNAYLSSEDSDPEATEILNNLKALITAQKAYASDFTFVIEMPGYDEQEIEGNLLQEGLNYKLVLDNQTVQAYGNTQWTYNREKNEVLVEDRDTESGSAILTPLEMLEFYETCDYVYAITNAIPSNGGSVYEIEFKPIAEDSEYSKLRMAIRGKEKPVLDYLKIFNKDGSRYTLNIEKMDFLSAVDEATFQFNSDLHPDVHVEDLRF